MAIEIRQVKLGGDLKDFMGVVGPIYRDDPAYVRPLDMDLSARLGKKNPFFEHAECVYFVAYRNGVSVGRISAQIDKAHLEAHHDDAGFFGFFDTIDDAEVAEALLQTAATWLSDRGMRRMRGPLSLSIYDEPGCLIEGFDKPPMYMMGHHRPYQSKLIEAGGFERCRTLYAWEYHVGPLKKRVAAAHDELSALPELTSRQVNMSNIDADTGVVMDVFNDAWSENWGHVAATPQELRKLSKDFKLILRPEITQLAFIDGEPAAVAVALPNLNEVIRDFDGKLFPFGLPKLLYRLKIDNPKTARLVILGIRKKYRNVRKYAGLSLFLYAKLNEGGKKLGIQWGELSWTDEANAPVNTAIKMMGGKVYKRYAIYERELQEASEKVNIQR